MELRTIVQAKAEAMFFSGSNVTVRAKRDCYEIIFKYQRGQYGVVSLVPVSPDGECKLLVSFGDFFTEFFFPMKSKYTKQFYNAFRVQCPKCIELVEKGTKDGYDIVGIEGKHYVGCSIKPTVGKDFLLLIGDARAYAEAALLLNYCFDLYVELWQSRINTVTNWLRDNL